MSEQDLNKGAEFYIYEDHGSRIGIVDNEIGPGVCDIVQEEMRKAPDGTNVWHRLGTVFCVDFHQLRALAAAADLMEGWEGESDLKGGKYTVTIEPKAHPSE